MTEHFACPVCGYPDLPDEPRGAFGGSYEICPSCGFQFGVTDDDEGFTDAAWRERWIQGGLSWSSAAPPPPGWDAAAQLARIVDTDRSPTD